MDSVQRTVVLEALHIKRKVLQPESWSLSCGVTIGPREEVPEERKPVIRDDDDKNNNHNKNSENDYDDDGGGGSGDDDNKIMCSLLNNLSLH